MNAQRQAPTWMPSPSNLLKDREKRVFSLDRESQGISIFPLHDLELRIMSSNEALGERDTGLAHLHVCIHCGHPRRRNEVGDGEVRLGILHCPKCGEDGPLNIEIQELRAG